MEKRQPPQTNLKKQLVETMDKNLDFFRQVYPELYSTFSSYTPTSLQLNILADGHYDLLDNRCSIYGGNAEGFAAQEAETFLNTFAPGNLYQSVQPPFSGAYSFQRRFSRAIDTLLDASPLKPDQYNGTMTMPDFYPMVVFLGCGLGFHIEKIVSSIEIDHLLIFEKRYDAFFLSLYTVDWAALCEKVELYGGEVQFVLGGEDRPEEAWHLLWNQLIRLYPQFPTSTLYYNHRGLDDYDKISDTINEHLPLHLYGWGNYDDELNQLNQSLHNIYLNFTFARPIQFTDDSTDTAQPTAFPSSEIDIKEVPYCIVAAGPSLDNRIEQLKRHRDRLYIVSCASAITALYRYGIVPDIHFEMESDYLIVNDLWASIPDESYWKKIKLIAPIQLNPFMMKKVGDVRLFFKEEGVATGLFHTPNHLMLKYASPTCTNLALSYGITQGFEKILFVGMDYGFKDLEHHHSKKSAYYDKNLSDDMVKLSKINTNELFQIESIDGSPLFTGPFYLNSKLRLEECLAERLQYTPPYNLSDGANIRGSIWQSKEQSEQVLAGYDLLNREAITELFFNSSDISNNISNNVSNNISNNTQLSSDHVESNIARLIDSYTQLIDWIFQQIPPHFESTRALFKFTYALRKHMEIEVKEDNPALYDFIGGSIKHFTYIATSHILSHSVEEECVAFSNRWRETLLRFSEEAIIELKEYMSKSFDVEKDPTLKRSLEQAVPTEG